MAVTSTTGGESAHAPLLPDPPSLPNPHSPPDPPLLPNNGAQAGRRSRARRRRSATPDPGIGAGASPAPPVRPARPARPDWWSAGRVRRDWLVTLIGLELVVLVVAVLVASRNRWMMLVGLPALMALLVLVAARVRRRWVPLWIAVALAYRRRRTRIAAAARRGVPAIDTLMDAARLTSFADRTGMTFGVLRSGRVWSLTMSVETGHGDILTAAPTAELPLEALPWVLEGRDIDLYEARVVVHQAGSQARVPAACRRRLVWISLSIDPHRCPAAVEARGGGTTGSLRALTAQAARLAVRCSDLGVRLVPLDGEHLRSALGLCVQTPPSQRQSAGPPLEYGETWRHWNGGPLTYATYWLERLPRGAGVEDVLDLLSGLPAESLTVSLAVRRAAGRVTQRVLVRTGCLPDECAQLRGELTATLHRHGLRGVPLDGQHVLGVRATLPVVLAS
jgi:ESX secretion system protein EccE